MIISVKRTIKIAVDVFDYVDFADVLQEDSIVFGIDSVLF